MTRRAWWWLIPALVVWLAVPMTIIMIAATTASAGQNCGPGGTATTVEDVDLSAEQLANAQLIVGVVRQQQLPARAAVIALATAMQESTLRNLPHLGGNNDHDSIGLFQQRISIYGAATAGDPVKSTTAFLAKLVTQDNWQTRPLTDVAADVQIPRADLRGEYAQWETLAHALTERFWPGAAAVMVCSGGAGDPALTAGGGIPDGYQLPNNAQQHAAVGFALAQLGEPYVFGANGPDTWDCSSLMQQAWAAAGVAIPRVTYNQVDTGVAVPGLAAIQPGDLIFIPGSLGTPSTPRHVGMYIGVGGDGKHYLVQAPSSGDVVKVTAVSSWASQIVAIRRPVTAQ
ncbi:C40 family peptidase [Salinispora mooreana]|uniref:C40 family peptidase n=1 Tax=Salinispora mooreana TaxID=999545 RepID=UPI000370E5C0|nr:C40 family peptidase [Salinispora mooreana]